MSAPYDRVTNEPGGCDCRNCGVVFIGGPEHSLCAVCDANRTQSEIPLSLPICERLRSYYTMFAGRPHFSNKLKVHKAVDLHEAVDTIEQLYEALADAVDLLLDLDAEGGPGTILSAASDALAKARGAQ